MAEYIDRDAFLEHMKKTGRYFDVKFDIEDFPAADVVPVVHGRWIHKRGGFWEVADCSACGERWRHAGMPWRTVFNRVVTHWMELPEVLGDV